MAYSTFDFTDYFAETEQQIINEEASNNEVEEISEVKEDAIDEVIETEISAEVISKEVDESSAKTTEEISSGKKVGVEEEAILKVIGEALDKLDKSRPVSEQVENFMNEIGMPISAKLVSQSFVIACDIKKINYENIILELHKLNPNIKDEIIKASLKENFKIWLKQYPKLVEKFPKMSITAVLKVFAKRFA